MDLDALRQSSLKACGSPREYQKVKPGSESPWILAYVPIRSCHRVLKGKYEEFSPPAYHGDSPINFWCNWTIWAGTRQHIIIYIQGFVSEEGCNRNEDKILFEGVSSLVENSVVYACWKKETHAFATFARAVHVVLLKRHLPNRRDVQFKGKYYIFQDQEGESSSKDDVISESPAPKLPKEDDVFQSGWTKNLRDALGSRTTRSTVSLGKTTALSSELMPGRGIMLDATAVGSLRCCKPQGRGTPEGIVPTAAQDTWGPSLSVSGDITTGFGYTHTPSSMLLETPLLGALQAKKPFLQPAGVGLESRQSALHPTLGPKDVGDLQFNIKPTCTSCTGLAALSQSLSPGRRESKESTDSTMYRGVSAVSTEKAESHPQLSVPTDGTASSDADGLAKGLMPSLSSPYEVVNRDHSHLLPEGSQGCQSSLRGLSMTQSVLGTTGLQHTKRVVISPLESFRGIVRGETALQPAAPWDILQEHPHLHGQSSHILKTSPTDPGGLLQNAQAHIGSAAEKAHVSSFAVQSCHRQSDRAAQPGLIVPPLPTGLEHSPTAVSTPGTEATPALVVSCTAPVLADFGSTDLIPAVPFAPEPVSRVLFSPPTALHSDPVSLRQSAGISLAGPGEQEMLSPSPPHHTPVAFELGTHESTRHLSPGMPKLVLGEAGGQQAETSASVALMGRGPSPASITVPGPDVGLPQAEDRVSSGYGVASASLPGAWEARRVENMVPVHHQLMAGNDKLASASILRGVKIQKTIEAPQGHAEEERNASSSTTPAHPAPPVAPQGETLSRDQKLQEPSDGKDQTPGGQHQKHAELGPPWTMEYFPIRSCHLVFQSGSGMFYLPLHADIKTSIWCNWTIWAGSQKHIVIYVQGFHGSDGCGKNQDKIIFQGISSSVETKVVYACQSRGTLIFATQAPAVHVLFLSGNGSVRHEYRSFRGQYYVFRDSETMGSSNDATASRKPVQETSKKEGWKTAVTKGLLPMLRASASPSAIPVGGRTQPQLVSPDEETQRSPYPMEDAQYGANLSEYDQLWDETKLQRSLEDSGTEGRETEADILVEQAPSGQGAGRKAEPSTLEVAKGDAESVSALITTAGAPSSEVPSSSAGLLAKSSSLDRASSSLSDGVAATAHLTQTPVLEEPLLNTSTKPPLYPSPGVNAGDMVSLGESMEKFFDLASALASLENSTALQSQHHPGDVLFEVTIEIKPKDWIPHGGSELQKGLLESMKNHIQENLKLPASRVNELKLKEIKRTSDANLLLTFWLHLKPEERNMSLLLHSQLEELLGSSAGAEKLHLVSLFVEDVNECSAGVGLCGEEAECFNGVGTYLCRCKKDYEDHSPTKSGTLCVPAAQSGISFFLRHADILVGAAITAALSMLVAAGVLCRAAVRGRHLKRTLSLEEPPARAAEEPVMELHDLGQCLRIDPFQLKLRARPPEWLWAARVHHAQEYRVFLEQSPQL
ncbi:uncharacterized protein LOC136015776 isoform X2 [Lathamus discolor]|uniref:uncharacterized protein LOC136015776 isoform X2 n=1 Tax=Lathamus discolor TaxID=678569 RepID=UPI0032B75AFB